MENENLNNERETMKPCPFCGEEPKCENENLQQNAIDDTITVSNANDGNAAGAGAPEDTASDYQAIISQQGDTIDALLQATERLQQQIQRILRNGASITDDTAKVNDSAAGNSGINPPPQLTPEDIMSKPDYEPLAALGKEIGKKPKRE